MWERFFIDWNILVWMPGISMPSRLLIGNLEKK